uniref:Uncharacterized protein n=1 Tax=Chromera velia CCMP2878 TaxID=1169474 RepID=A0A0G4F5U2_9ALVE|eukprot:Cvel_15204.t1-p1 / transcript=Cvel_15204.t1 / gene=Cvel_15204 / organism=Chromera_velia_CCMP2878 / gene_product=hypothetical protein / transcript_product=hypothetical protein / location=Cvel_scaffold1112:7016-8545(+) / protein_length=434 / sequence_SO=supercontig / SO=protein_coding / is_pseudo=false
MSDLQIQLSAEDQELLSKNKITLKTVMYQGQKRVEASCKPCGKQFLLRRANNLYEIYHTNKKEDAEGHIHEGSHFLALQNFKTQTRLGAFFKQEKPKTAAAVNPGRVDPLPPGNQAGGGDQQALPEPVHPPDRYHGLCMFAAKNMKLKNLDEQVKYLKLKKKYSTKLNMEQLQYNNHPRVLDFQDTIHAANCPFVPVEEKAHLNFSSGSLSHTKWHLSSECKELQEVKADKNPLHKQKDSLLFFGEVEKVLEKYKFTHHEDLLKLRRDRASADQIAHLQSLHDKEVKHISSVSCYDNALYSAELPKLKVRVALLKDHTKMFKLNTHLGYIAQDRFLIDFCDLHMKGLINNTAFLDLAKCFTARVLGHKNAPLGERWSACMHVFCADGGDRVRKELRDNLVAVNKKYFDHSKKKMEGAVDNLFDTTKAKVAERLE